MKKSRVESFFRGYLVVWMIYTFVMYAWTGSYMYLAVACVGLVLNGLMFFMDISIRRMRRDHEQAMRDLLDPTKWHQIEGLYMPHPEGELWLKHFDQTTSKISRGR